MKRFCFISIIVLLTSLLTNNGAFSYSDVYLNANIKRHHHVSVYTTGHVSYANDHSCSGWIKNVESKIKNNLRSQENTRKKVIVSFNINERGRTESTYFQLMSGDSRFNNSVLRAIKSSEPFGTPPFGCTYDNVVIRFFD